MRVVVHHEKHLTASVWIVSKDTDKVLLVYHKKMNSWLQPGGHVELFENPIETAIREVKEETGLDISFLKEEITTYDEFTKSLPVPTFFLEETIPADKDQPEHFHLDLMYRVEVAEQALQLNEKESHQIGWFTKDEALKLPLLKNVKELILIIF